LLLEELFFGVVVGGGGDVVFVFITLFQELLKIFWGKTFFVY